MTNKDTRSESEKKFSQVDLNRQESTGIIRALKWVLFLQSYKSKNQVTAEINKFINEEIKLFPDLKDLEEY